jgi:hypothetical protein
MAGFSNRVENQLVTNVMLCTRIFTTTIVCSPQNSRCMKKAGRLPGCFCWPLLQMGGLACPSAAPNRFGVTRLAPFTVSKPVQRWYNHLAHHVFVATIAFRTYSSNGLHSFSGESIQKTLQ